MAFLCWSRIFVFVVSSSTNFVFIKYINKNKKLIYSFNDPGLDP